MCLDLTLQNQLSPFLFNQRLLQALSDDACRAALYADLAQRRQVLSFQSTAAPPVSTVPPGTAHQTVVLLTDPAHIQLALTNDSLFSNDPYQALGSGGFMLGLDGTAHALQRGFAARLMRYDPVQIGALCQLAFRTAAVLPLQTRRFNAAELAEQTALRFAAMLFGYPSSDHPYLEAAMRTSYQQLVHQIIGRHFSLQPQLATDAQRAGGGFLLRTDDLLSRLARGERHEDLLELQDLLRKQATTVPALATLASFRPVCQRLVEDEHSDLSLAELATVIGGLIAGTIGNVQAAVAITLDHFFKHAGTGGPPLETLAAWAQAAGPGSDAEASARARAQLQASIQQALAANPPAAFLPRRVVADFTLPPVGGQTPADGAAPAPGLKLAAGTQVVLAMGAATSQKDGQALVFGGPPARSHIHQCLGEHLGQPLITEIVRGILCLPGLVRALDADTGEVLPLKKTWGFRCDSLMLEHRRDAVMRQQPLAIIMKIKAPVAANAEKLKAIIGVGAPRIELRLQDSHQVHFAWFLLLENDTKLALFTTYDGGFDAYLRHFAFSVGSLFDRLFECLDEAPPLPVAQHPDAFIETLRRFNATPVGSYFFSAYPQAGVAAIQHALKAAGQPPKP